MTQNYKIPFSLTVKLLEAYEDKTPPPGAAQDHPVGHAVVKLIVENLTQGNISFDVRQIEIYEPNNKVLFSQKVKSLNLGGLEILEQGFHLTNPQGFMGSKKVKALVSYQFNGKIYVVESRLLQVVFNP